MKTAIELFTGKSNDITFSITSYFDPYGDKKSTRKVFKRRFFKTMKTKEEIIQLFKKKNESRDYYSELTLNFPSKPYKIVKDFDFWGGR